MVALLTSLLASKGTPDASVLAGLAPSDDAAVYRLDDDRALVASVDFFPPLVDDPTDYGRVAAANAVSDVYAMGGTVAFALIVSGFPEGVATETVVATSAAAADVVAACGGQVLGGHSIRCKEPVFGLCVLGFVHPQAVWRKSGAKPGDVLMLSKPLGTGVLLSAGLAAGMAAAIQSMCVTNRDAAAALAAGPVSPSAVTDVTGYGLIGHAAEMAVRSEMTFKIESPRVPLLRGALEAAQRGCHTSADSSLRLTPNVTLAKDLDPAIARLLYDPQTSGGLLAAVEAAEVSRLAAHGFRRIGCVEAGPAAVIIS